MRRSRKSATSPNDSSTTSPMLKSPSALLGRKFSNAGSNHEADVLRDQVTELDIAKKKAEDELRALRDEINFRTEAIKAAEAATCAALAESRRYQTQLEDQALRHANAIKRIQQQTPLPMKSDELTRKKNQPSIKKDDEQNRRKLSLRGSSENQQLNRSANSQASSNDKRLKMIAAQLSQEHEFRIAAEQRAKRLDALYQLSFNDIQSARINQNYLETCLKRDLDLTTQAEKRVDESRQSAILIATQIERIGNLFATSGELSEAEMLFKQSATIRSALFGAPHSQHADGFRNLASHCQKQNNLPAALSYLEQSCSELSSSLRTGEQIVDMKTKGEKSTVHNDVSKRKVVLPLISS